MAKAADKANPQAPATAPTADSRPRAEKAHEPPTIGRIVHYKTPADERQGSLEWPAIITHVYDPTGGTVDLTIFCGGQFGVPEHAVIIRAPSVLYDPQRRPHTWHWPER